METNRQRNQVSALALLHLSSCRVLCCLCSHFYMKDYREVMYKIQDSYKFGFRDYLKGNEIFERALAVNRLEELL